MKLEKRLLVLSLLILAVAFALGYLPMDERGRTLLGFSEVVIACLIGVGFGLLATRQNAVAKPSNTD